MCRGGTKYMCVSVHMPKCIHEEARIRNHVPCYAIFCLFLLIQSLTKSGSVLAAVFPVSSCVCLPEPWCFRKRHGCMDFHMCVGLLDSGPHTCTACMNTACTHWTIPPAAEWMLLNVIRQWKSTLKMDICLE